MVRFKEKKKKSTNKIEKYLNKIMERIKKK